jgi:cytochrome P450
MDEPALGGDAQAWFDELYRPEVRRAPQSYYREVRDTHPVIRTPSIARGEHGGAGGDDDGSDKTMIWVAKRSDIDSGLRCPEVYSSRLSEPVLMLPTGVDPPDHVKYRRILDPLFAPRNMNKLEEPITQYANELIDAFIERGECDYITEFAIPLPCNVFLRLVGLPLDELGDWLRLKDALMRGSGETAMLAFAEVDERFEALVIERRRDPRDDVLSQLLSLELEGEALSHDELLAIFRLLLVAGLDTVTASLACFYSFLSRNPEHRRRLVNEPTIIPAAVEELMRYESPVPYLPRVVTTAAELGGCPINAGEDVVFMLGSGNTDELFYDRPDLVDFDRPSVRHLSFGGGIHRCLGSHLARIELRVSLREWHRRIPDYHIPDDVELDFLPLVPMAPRQLDHLPLVFDQVAG